MANHKSSAARKRRKKLQRREKQRIQRHEDKLNKNKFPHLKTKPKSSRDRNKDLRKFAREHMKECESLIHDVSESVAALKRCGMIVASEMYHYFVDVGLDRIREDADKAYEDFYEVSRYPRAAKIKETILVLNLMKETANRSLTELRKVSFSDIKQLEAVFTDVYNRYASAVAGAEELSTTLLETFEEFESAVANYATVRIEHLTKASIGDADAIAKLSSDFNEIRAGVDEAVREYHAAKAAKVAKEPETVSDEEKSPSPTTEEAFDPEYTQDQVD